MTIGALISGTALIAVAAALVGAAGGIRPGK